MFSLCIRVILPAAQNRLSSFNNLVDDNPILGMHADKAAPLTGGRHRTENRSVINQEDPGVSHKEFKAGNPLIHGSVQLLDLTVFQFGCDEMKAVVDRSFALRFSVSVVDTLEQ